MSRFSLLASSFWSSVTTYFANFDGATNICRTIALWLTLALTAAFTVCKFAIAKDKQQKVNKISLFCAIGYAAAILLTFTVCSFVEDEIVAITFYPLLIFVIACIVGGLSVAVKPLKITKICVISAIAASFAAALVCLIVYYTSGDASEWNWIPKEDVSDVGLYISAAAVIAAIIVLAILADKTRLDFDSRSLSFAAVCIAMSFALSYVRIFKMPMGGSITFASMLPLMLYSYMFGTKKGVTAGLIYGVLQAVQNPWILHPAQFLLDYTAAFSALGLTGILKGFNLLNGKTRLQFSLGATVAGLFRFISHFFAGAFAFGSAGAGYAEEFGVSALSNPYLYSFVYQCTYVIPDLIIVIVAGTLILSSKNFRSQLEKYSNAKCAIPNGTPSSEAAATETANDK